MAYELKLEPNETLISRWTLRVSEKVKPFCFAVSNRAIYWPSKKWIALKDPYFFNRIRHNHISSVSIQRLSPYPWWILAALMIAGGLFVSILMMVPVFRHEPGSHHISGKPFGILAGGILMPFVVRGRYGLRISTVEKSLSWKPPLVVDRASKEKIMATLDQILTAAKQAGLRTFDERLSR